ncbi:MAG: hypothetical protein KF842_06755 [Caulobacter sp.]|nr:hypothetical protein [Caulobacter sp.]
MTGEKKGVGVRVYVDGEATAKRSFDEIADSGKKMFAEIAMGSKTAAPAVEGLNAASGAARKSVAGLAGVAEGAGSALMALGPAGVAAAGALVAMKAVSFGIEKAREAMDFAGELTNTAKALNVTTDALQEWRFVLKSTGSDSEDADRALEQFRVTLGKARSGLDKGSVKVFEALGMDEAGLEAFGSTEDAFDEVIKRVSQLKDEAEQAAIADKLGLSDMLPAIRLGASGIAHLRDEAHRLGVVMDDELVRRAGEAQDQFDTLSQVIDVQMKQAFVDLAPAIVAIVGLVADLARAMSDLADSWRDLDHKSTEGLRKQLTELKGERNRLGIAEMLGKKTAGPYGTSAERAVQMSAMNAGDTSMTAVPIKSALTDLDGRIDDLEKRLKDREPPPKPKTKPGSVHNGTPSGAKSGPTPEEQAAALKAIELEQQLAVARARGDDAATEMLASEQFLAAQRDRYVKAGLSLAEAQARAQDDADARARAANLKTARDIEEDWIKANTVKAESGAGIAPMLPTDVTIGQDGGLWTAEQKAAWARDVGDATAQGLDAALHGDFWDFMKQRFYQASLDGLSNGIQQALAAADFNAGASAGGNSWSGMFAAGFNYLFGSGQSSGRAAGGGMSSGWRYGYGEHGRPELAMLSGNGYVADYEATQRMLTDAIAAAGGGGGQGPRRVDVYLKSEVQIPSGHVSDRQLAAVIQAAHDDAIKQALKHSGAAVGKQQADARFLKG